MRLSFNKVICFDFGRKTPSWIRLWISSDFAARKKFTMTGSWHSFSFLLLRRRTVFRLSLQLMGQKPGRSSTTEILRGRTAQPPLVLMHRSAAFLSAWHNFFSGTQRNSNVSHSHPRNCRNLKWANSGLSLMANFLLPELNFKPKSHCHGIWRKDSEALKDFSTVSTGGLQQRKRNKPILRAWVQNFCRAQHRDNIKR